MQYRPSLADRELEQRVQALRLRLIRHATLEAAARNRLRRRQGNHDPRSGDVEREIELIAFALKKYC
jgi:hypothetical protein